MSESVEQAKPGWPAAIVLALLVVAAYLFIATRTSLFDRDEPRFSRATVEMVESGNYLYPTFNGKLRPDKPIMIYWVMSLGVRLFGQTEAAVRLQSVLAAGATAMLTWWMGRRMWDSRTGLWAAAILATTPLMAVMSTFATADGVLLFFLTAAMAVYVDAVFAGRMGPWRVVLMGLAMGGAALTKGPLGLLPLLSVLVTWWLLRRAKKAGPTGDGTGEPSYTTPCMTGPIIAALIAVALFLVWGISANNATHGEFLRLGLGHHVKDRIFTPLEHHGGNWFYSLPFYIPVVIVGFFPWTLFLLGAAIAVWNHRLGLRQRALIIGFSLPTIAVMTVVSTKLPHYVLPAWPAMALAVAATLSSLDRGGLQDLERRWLRHGGALFAPVLAGLVVLAPVLWFASLQARPTWPWLTQAAMLERGPWMLLAVAALVAGTVTLWHHLHLRFAQSSRDVFVGAVIVGLIAAGAVLPALEPLKPSPRLAAAIRRAPPTAALATFGDPEPSLLFYADRDVEDVGPSTLTQWAAELGPGVLVIPQFEFDRARERGELDLVQIGQASGLSNTRGRPLDLLVLGRHLPDLH